MPAVLVFGVIAPVLALMLKPVVEEYVPAVVPVCVTAVSYTHLTLPTKRIV